MLDIDLEIQMSELERSIDMLELEVERLASEVKILEYKEFSEWKDGIKD